MWIHAKKGQKMLLPSGAKMVFTPGCRHWCPDKFVGLLEEGSYWEDDGEGNPLIPLIPEEPEVEEVVGEGVEEKEEGKEEEEKEGAVEGAESELPLLDPLSSI